MENYYENEKFSLLKLSGEVISDARFIDCEFRDCTFDGVKLTNVSFSGCGFAYCYAASLEFVNCCISDAMLFNCTAYGISWGELMAAGKLSQPLESVRNSKLRGNIFEKMSMRKFSFESNSLLECLFSECDLRESSFRGCNMEGTELLRCDLREADLRGARGYAPDIFSCKMKGAAFSSTEALSLLRALEIELD